MQELIKKRFSGYVVATVEGFYGMEEGTLVFWSGKIIAASHEYLRYGVIINGDPAVSQAMNAFAAEFGVVDIVELSPTEAELILAVNPKTMAKTSVNPNDVKKLIPKKFSPEYAKKTLSIAFKKTPSKKEIFKRIGLDEMI